MSGEGEMPAVRAKSLPRPAGIKPMVRPGATPYHLVERAVAADRDGHDAFGDRRRDFGGVVRRLGHAGFVADAERVEALS